MGADGMAALQRMAAVFAMITSAKPMMERMQAESRRLEGTVLLSTSTMETVKSAEEMKAAAEAPPPSAGGGLGGLMARRLAGRRGGAGEGPRSMVLTNVHEFMTIATSASDADVAVPAGFRERR
jgi:hypothetical protein